jgi:nucleoside-diphosphate kinase
LAQDRTFIAVKPDGVERGLVGEIIRRFETRGLKLVGLKVMNVSSKMAEEHYGEHKGKPFFDGLVKHITSGPIVAMVWEGKNVVAITRSTIGATNPVDATPGSIRGDLAVDIGRNIVHGSDSPANAEREINIFFKAEELLPVYAKAVDKWTWE